MSAVDVAATDGETDIVTAESSLSGVGVLDLDGGGQELPVLLALELFFDPLRSVLSFELSLCRSTKIGFTGLTLPDLV